MKFAILGSIVLFSTFLFGQGNPPPDVIHADGASASVYAFNNDVGIYLSVNRGSNAFIGEQSTYLFYNSFTYTSDGSISTFGSGFIPNDSLTGGNAAHLSLNLDTSQVASFHTTTCTSSVTSFIITCTDNPGGLINIEWRQNSAYSFHSVVTIQQNFFQTTVQSHGESDLASALVNGSVLGTPLNNAFGTTGTNRDMTIFLFKNH